MDYIIESIIGLTADLYCGYSKEDARELYLQGGCYELAKIIKDFVDGITIYINKEKDHCVFSFEGVLYDANGIVRENIENYRVASETEIKFMEKNFGFFLKGLRLYENITLEVRKKTLGGILQRYRSDLLQNSRQQRH